MKKIKYTFEQCCLDNERQDILDRWDNELNSILPSEVSAKTDKKYWFKCPRGIHESELKTISSFAYGKAKEIKCIKCNSFAQHCIDKYGEEYFNKIWSSDNIVSPWEVSYGSATKVLLNDDNYPEGKHLIGADKFFRTDTEYKPPNDEIIKFGQSLGDLRPECIGVWSDRNDKTPYDFHVCSDESVFWKCPNGIHDDFQRKIVSSKTRNFTCPKCGRSGVGLIDLTGKQFGELTVVGFDRSIDGIPYWSCHCSCGNDVSIRGISLRTGNTKTCGDRLMHYSGKDNPNWKGGEKTENQRIRSSKPYKHWRDSIIKKYGSICSITGTISNDPELHHIFPVSIYPQYMFEEWNTILLDAKYHNMFIKGSFHHKYGSKNNTPEQLEKYINEERKKCGFNELFDVYKYLEMMKIKAMDSDIKKPVINF